MTEEELTALCGEFAESCDAVRDRVIAAAWKRFRSGRPAMTQQDVQEQCSHMVEHAKLAAMGQVGDENSVTAQWVHTVCRALLTLFAWKRQHGLTTEQMMEEGPGLP